MGICISTIQSIAAWILDMEKKDNSICAPPQQDPHRLLSTAAGIAAAQRRLAQARQESEENGNRPCTSTLRRYDSSDESDMEDALSHSEAESSSSDNDGELKGDANDEEESDCPSESIMRRRRQEIYDMNKQNRNTFERVIIQNQETYEELKENMEYRCRPSTSVMKVCRRMQLGGCGGMRNPGPVVRHREKCFLENRFFPNSRKTVDKLRTKFFCCQYVDNGAQLAIAAQDETIRFYSPAGKNRKYYLTSSYRLIGVSWSILDVAMAPDGRSLAYGTWKDAVIYCKIVEPSQEAPEGITFHTLTIPSCESSTAVFSLRFNRNGEEVIAGSSDRGLHVFNVETQTRVVNVEEAHDDDVNAVCYGDYESYLLYSGGDDGLVKVWDRRALNESDARPVGVFAGHRDGITYIDSRGDNRFLISNSKDQTIKLWDLRKFSSQSAVDETMNAVRSQKWDYRWQTPPAKLQRLQKFVPGDTSVLTLRGHCVLHTLVRAKFSPENTGRRYVYSGCARGEVVVYDLLSGQVDRRLPGHVSVVRDASWNPDANEIASTAWDGEAAVWRWDERQEQKRVMAREHYKK